MTIIIAGASSYDISCIVFDKDGTLIDFNLTLGKRTADWIQAMVARVNKDDGLAAEISRTIGYDWINEQVLPDGPIAVTTAQKLIALASGELYKQGLPWHEAERTAVETILPTLGADFQEGEIVPLGEVLRTFQRLKGAGLLIAVATGDDRKPTIETLEALGITALVDAIVCGDDDWPEKPDPAVLQGIARELGIDPGQMLMVGDTVNDMLAGRNAGVAGCIGITGSIGNPTQLAEYADVLLERIDQIITAV